MSALFETNSIGNLQLNNRFVRSATWTGLADEDGACTAPLTEKMVELARGEVGLIFASIGLTAGILSGAVYSAILIMVILSTFIVPPVLKLLFARKPPPEPDLAMMPGDTLH